MNPYEQFKELRPCKKIVANELEGLDFESVLEVGTQYGECLLAIKNKFPDKRLVGIDIDTFALDDGRKVTGLDLRHQDANTMDFEPNSFDVVFTEALFCMLPIIRVEGILRKIIKTAKKHIILVELTAPSGIKTIYGLQGKERIGVNWKEAFGNYGLTTEIKKIPLEVWDGEPWKTWGQIITVKI